MTSSDLLGTLRKDGSHALRTVVRIMCAIRLVVLGLAVVQGLRDGVPSTSLLIAVLAAPFSFVPALNWDTRGVAYVRNGLLLAADVVVTVAVLSLLLGSVLVPAYGAATVALWGVTTGTRLALLMAVPIYLLLMPWTGQLNGWRDLLPSAVAVAGALAMAWVGGALGASVRRQDQVTADLAEERVARARADERVRLARDLHDTVTGDLAGVMLLTENLRSRLEATGGADDQAVELARTVERAVRESHRHTRTALGELRESAADPLTAATQLVDRWRERTGMRVELELDPGLSRLSPERWTHLQAVLLELLENVRKHAQASRVQVTLTGRACGRAEVTVVDDGVGMPREAAGDGHFGLRGIRERAAECDGEAIWSPAPDGGTLARVTFGAPAMMQGEAGD